MANILFLAHRIPYPPNKGDKIRSWHFLEYLAEQHTVHLGFYVDDPADERHVSFLKERVASLSYEKVRPFWQKIRSLIGLIDGRPLTLAAYPKRKLQQYVRNCIINNDIDVVFLFSGATAQLLPDDIKIPIITDLVDVDSEKWAAYANTNRWPISALYGREARILGAYEKALAYRSSYTLLVSQDEANLLLGNMPKKASVMGVTNGVDTRRFDPARYKEAPDPAKVIFTGAMNYAPNVEAVVWFAEHMWPLIRERNPKASFCIAGGPAVAAVKELGKLPGITVTGYVDDMVAEIASAAIAVAPMRTARGIQNKVLEAMAMAKPVVATPLANEGINAVDEQELLVAGNEEGFINSVCQLLEDPSRRETIGKAARSFVTKQFSWEGSFQKLDELLTSASVIQEETL